MDEKKFSPISHKKEAIQLNVEHCYVGEQTMTPQELETKIDQYFEECGQSGVRPTRPGLCAALGISTATWDRWLLEGEKRSVRGKENPYAALAWPLRRAMLRIADVLEQRTDTMARFLLRQPCYGGYTEKEDSSNNGNLNIHVTFGKTGKQQATEFGK